MSVLLLDDTANIRTITLNRPERRNALTPELIDALTLAIREAEDAGARAIILRGAGDAFCAGLDIDALRQSLDKSSAQHQADAERIASMFRAVWDADLPIIALVQGPAIAGGTGLATICDFTLAAPDARFGFTEARIGFIPALVSAYLALQLGDKQARNLLLTARLFDAEEALRLGLITEVVPREQLDSRANDLLQSLLANSLASLRTTKRLLRAQQATWLDNALSLAMEANAQARETPDFREGVSAFLEKRKPIWKS